MSGVILQSYELQPDEKPGSMVLRTKGRQEYIDKVAVAFPNLGIEGVGEARGQFRWYTRLANWSDELRAPVD